MIAVTSDPSLHQSKPSSIHAFSSHTFQPSRNRKGSRLLGNSAPPSIILLGELSNSANSSREKHKSSQNISSQFSVSNAEQTELINFAVGLMFTHRSYCSLIYSLLNYASILSASTARTANLSNCKWWLLYSERKNAICTTICKLFCRLTNLCNAHNWPRQLAQEGFPAISDVYHFLLRHIK